MDNVINRTPKKSIIFIYRKQNKRTTTATTKKQFTTGEKSDTFLDKTIYEGYGALTTVENLHNCTDHYISEKI